MKAYHFQYHPGGDVSITSDEIIEEEYPERVLLVDRHGRPLVVDKKQPVGFVNWEKFNSRR